jgi:excisionase family DNA binding protein
MSIGGRISVDEIAKRLSIGRATVYAMLESESSRRSGSGDDG